MSTYVKTNMSYLVYVNHNLIQIKRKDKESNTNVYFEQILHENNMQMANKGVTDAKLHCSLKKYRRKP